MSKYQFNASDIYLPGTDIPKNRLGITEPDLLHQVEEALLQQALSEAKDLTKRNARPGILGLAEHELTLWHADAVELFLQENSLSHSNIDVIGFHGQTVIHRPDIRLTVQLGDGAALARRTGCTVVHDMRAADVAPSRLDAAKAAATKILDGLRFRDEAAIIIAGDTPDVIAGMSDQAPTLRDAVNGIPASDNSTRLSAALELGRQLIGEHPHGQIVVLTDGAVDVKDFLLAGESDTFGGPLTVSTTAGPRRSSKAATPIEYRLFATAASNVGITQWQVRRTMNDPLGYEILASVRNASAKAVACRLELSLDDVPVDIIPLMLKPEERWSRSIEKTSLAGGRLHGKLTQIRSANDCRETVTSTGMTSDEPDMLMTDNSAWALLPGRKTQSVLIVSQDNLFLQKVFEANPMVEVTVRKDFPAEWPADSIIVLHGQVPKILPSGSVFVVDPIGSCDQWEQGTAIENPIVTEQENASPLMHHIRLENVIMPEAKQLTFTRAFNYK